MNSLVQEVVKKHLGNHVPDQYIKVFQEISERIDLNGSAADSLIKLSSEEARLAANEPEELNGDYLSAGSEMIDGSGHISHTERFLQDETDGQLERERDLLNEIRHLKAMQKVAKIGSWELNLTGNNQRAPVYWSDELLNILGLEAKTALTYEIYSGIVHPEDRNYLDEQVSTVVKTNGRYDIEYRIIPPGSGERTVREVAQVIMDGLTSQPSKLVGITIDITDTKTTQSALAEANVQLKILSQTMKEVFYSVDMRDKRLMQMSPGCKVLYGREVEEFELDTDLWYKVILDEDKQQVHDSYPALNRGETVKYEYRIFRKDGSVRWVETITTPTLDENGTLVRIDGINSDVTKRKEAEFLLRNSEQKFRSLIQNSNDAVTLANQELEFTFVSDSLLRITDFSSEELLGTSLLDFIHPEDKHMVSGLIPSLDKDPGSPFPFEARFRLKDSSWIWTDGFMTNFLNDPATNGYIINFRDISERRRYEEELKNSNDLLKKSNDELDRFVYSVSHDLRAPLASVSGLIEYTLTETEDPEVVENLNMMREGILKLDVFILDILDYSRNARLGIKMQKIDFSEILNDIKSNLKFMSAGGSQVEIRTEVQSPDEFYSDKSRLYIILNNLLSNSIRYHNPEAEQPYVEINVIPSGTGIELTVKDNGIGIEEQYQDSIFKMFFRVSEKSNGSGLGLYLVQETVQKLGGKFDFKSEYGVGTEFKIFLPTLDK